MTSSWLVGDDVLRTAHGSCLPACAVRRGSDVGRDHRIGPGARNQAINARCGAEGGEERSLQRSWPANRAWPDRTWQAKAGGRARAGLAGRQAAASNEFSLLTPSTPRGRPRGEARRGADRDSMGLLLPFIGFCLLRNGAQRDSGTARVALMGTQALGVGVHDPSEITQGEKKKRKKTWRSLGFLPVYVTWGPKSGLEGRLCVH